MEVAPEIEAAIRAAVEAGVYRRAGRLNPKHAAVYRQMADPLSARAAVLLGKLSRRTDSGYRAGSPFGPGELKMADASTGGREAVAFDLYQTIKPVLGDIQSQPNLDDVSGTVQRYLDLFVQCRLAVVSGQFDASKLK